jgi:hypothetical protein
MLVALNYEVNDETLTNMIRTVDSDLSGDLSFQEFVTLLIMINQTTTDPNNESSNPPSTETFQVHLSQFSNQQIERFFETFRSVGKPLPTPLIPARCLHQSVASLCLSVP